jgi:hypothetical protein
LWLERRNPLAFCPTGKDNHAGDCELLRLCDKAEKADPTWISGVGKERIVMKGPANGHDRRNLKKEQINKLTFVCSDRYRYGFY